MPTDHIDNADLNLLAIMSRYSTEEAARAWFEKQRWPNGPECPFCGNADQDRIYKLAGKGTRPGLYKCAGCRKKFTVTVGTVMEDSKIPLVKWLCAFYMMAASKTQVSAHQLRRELDIGQYKTALFMCHRIRFALSNAGMFPAKLTGTVECDETWIGGKHSGGGRGYVRNKTPVVSIVERGGNVRSTVVGAVSAETVGRVLHAHVSSDAILNTDESGVYIRHGQRFAAHDTVNHGAKEYARRDAKSGRLATTNAAEGFFGNSKRSIDGTHHHIGRHIRLYFAELDFKYNWRHVTDGERTATWAARIAHRRLTYRRMVDTSSHEERGIFVATMTPKNNLG